MPQPPKLPLPKIFPGTLRPTEVPSQRGIPVEQQPQRTIPGGMRVTTDPQTGAIQRDPRSPGEGTRPIRTPVDEVRDIMGEELRDRLRALLGMPTQVSAGATPPVQPITPGPQVHPDVWRAQQPRPELAPGVDPAVIRPGPRNPAASETEESASSRRKANGRRPDFELSTVDVIRGLLGL